MNTTNVLVPAALAYDRALLFCDQSSPGRFVLECSAEEIAQEAADAGVSNARYVSANLTMDNAADENVVVYIRSRAKRAYDGQTADVVA